jgi:AcrR family transcriptional regulator
MSRTSSPRRNATRLRLYEAAVTLVAEQGFAATTVEEIAERAGVAKGTVYYHFRGRTEFFENLLEHAGERFAAALRAAAEGERARGGGPAAALDAVVRAGLAFVRERPALVQVCAHELWRPGGGALGAMSWRQSPGAGRCPALLVIEGVLGDAADGPPAAGAATALTASGVLGMVVATALDWRLSEPQRSLDEVHAALRPVLPAAHGQP